MSVYKNYVYHKYFFWQEVAQEMYTEQGGHILSTDDGKTSSRPVPFFLNPKLALSWRCALTVDQQIKVSLQKNLPFSSPSNELEEWVRCCCSSLRMNRPHPGRGTLVQGEGGGSWFGFYDLSFLSSGQWASHIFSQLYAKRLWLLAPSPTFCSHGTIMWV